MTETVSGLGTEPVTSFTLNSASEFLVISDHNILTSTFDWNFDVREAVKLWKYEVKYWLTGPTLLQTQQRWWTWRETGRQFPSSESAWPSKSTTQSKHKSHPTFKPSPRMELGLTNFKTLTVLQLSSPGWYHRYGYSTWGQPSTPKTAWTSRPAGLVRTTWASSSTCNCSWR